MIPRLTNHLNMTTQSSGLLTLTNVTLALDNVLDYCTVEEIEILNRTSKELQAYISGYHVLRRAKLSLSPKETEAAVTLIRLSERTKSLPEPLYSPFSIGMEAKNFEDIYLGAYIDSAGASSLRTPRVYFNLCRIGEVTSLFIGHVLDRQQYLVELSKRPNMVGMRRSHECDQSRLSFFLAILSQISGSDSTA